MKTVTGFVGLFLGADTTEEMKRRGMKVSVLFAGIQAMDYLLMAVTAALVSFLKWRGMAEWGIFLVLWAGNMLTAGAVVLYCDRSGNDATLMEGARRVVGFVIERSLPLGLLLEAAFFVRLLLWDGPDQFIIFFRSRLPLRWMKCAVFATASCVQMAVWTMVYAKGYENVAGLLAG